MQHINTKLNRTLAVSSQKCNKSVTDETKKLSLQIRLSTQYKFIAFGFKVITQHF